MKNYVLHPFVIASDLTTQICETCLTPGRSVSLACGKQVCGQKKWIAIGVLRM